MPIDFPESPGLTPTYQYTYNGITQNWYWGFSGGSGVSAWLASGFSITSGGAGNQGFQGHTGSQGFQGHTGSQGFQGHTGFQGTTGPTGIIGSIFINNDEYTNQESIKFFSDHSITYSSASNILTITFGSELGTISGNTKDSGIAKWTYTVFDTSFDGSSWITGNSSVSGYNLLEVNNTSTTAYATSVTGSEGITLAGFTGFAVQPVPDGTKVELIYQAGTYFFSAPNPVTGEC